MWERRNRLEEMNSNGRTYGVLPLCYLLGVVGVTFNGFGLTNAIQGKLTDSQRMKIEELLVNVKGSEDPVFKMKWARHYGIVYNVPQECGMDLLAAHSLDTLIAEMQALETTASGDF